MKKIIVILTVLFTIVTSSYSQVKLGVQAGLNVTDVCINSVSATVESKCGFFVGPELDIDIMKWAGIDVSVLYNTKNIMLNDMTETLNYIDVPVNFKGIIDLGAMDIYVATGPQFSWNIGDTNILDNTYTLRSSMFSWNIGGGFTILKKVRAGYTYNIHCGSTAELKSIKGLLDNANKFKHHNHQIHVTYFF